MSPYWMLVVAVVAVAASLIFSRQRRSSRSPLRAPERRDGDLPDRDLNANVNPSQTGNFGDKWPDRTGAQTKRELGARRAVDMTFAGDRPEPQKAGRAQTANPNQPPGATPGVRREVSPGPHEHGPGTNPAADLAPEDQYGEDRPAARTKAPDQPPTQWHPEDHGVPGDHYRDGHHRSATAPTRKADTDDPYAHAPIPGPNHIIPEGGDELPPGTQP